MTTTGTLLTTNPAPGTPDWYRYMTASKIAAIMHHSTYDSYLSMWLKMAGKVAPEPMDDTKRRGHYLEPAILAWYRDQHPDWTIELTGMWVHPYHTWAASTPDGIITLPDGTQEGYEAKSSDLDYEWGEPGTDQIPAGYFDQVQWQMFTTGLRRVRVAVIMTHFVFAEYVIEYDRAYVKQMITTAKAFMYTLSIGRRPSLDPLDGHAATYKAIRELAPGINAENVELDPNLVRRYVVASADKKAAETRETAAKSMIADVMGEARTASVDKRTIFTRQSRGGGTPYLVAARNLPTSQELGALV